MMEMVNRLKISLIMFFLLIFSGSILKAQDTIPGRASGNDQSQNNQKDAAQMQKDESQMQKDEADASKNAKKQTEVKKVTGKNPALKRPSGARPPQISRPAGASRPQGTGKPAGVIRPGRK
jgi:sucrose-6-phosphate hydrolase SacC (GH32 family)